LRRAEAGAQIVGVFRVKNHDFTPKNHIFSNFSVGARAGCALPLDPPLGHQFRNLLTLIVEHFFNRTLFLTTTNAIIYSSTFLGQPSQIYKKNKCQGAG
jgi:hypothetical protein